MAEAFNFKFNILLLERQRKLQHKKFLEYYPPVCLFEIAEARREMYIFNREFDIDQFFTRK